MKTTILQFSAGDDTVTYEIPGEPDLPLSTWTGEEEVTSWTEEGGDPDASYETSEAHLDHEAALLVLQGHLDPWSLEDRRAA
jgi:hypothetical protein